MRLPNPTIQPFGNQRRIPGRQNHLANSRPSGRSRGGGVVPPRRAERNEHGHESISFLRFGGAVRAALSLRPNLNSPCPPLTLAITSMNRLSISGQAIIAAHLAEGVSVQSTARLCGCTPQTVLRNLL